MDYWESILQEVLHRGDDTYQFRFTDIGRSMLRERTRKQRAPSSTREHAPSPMYFLGERYEGIYFTKREAETVYYLLQGHTIPKVGKVLALSARTIEFYVKNMKLKVGAKSKQHLLEIVRTTEIMNQLGFVESLDAHEV